MVMPLFQIIKSRQCQERGLLHTFKWLAEFRHALRSVQKLSRDFFVKNCLIGPRN
jgi:hypothetical protein